MVSWLDSYPTRSPHVGPVRTDQLASTFSNTAFHGYRSTSYSYAGVGGDDLVDSMWFAAWVVLRAVHLIAKPRDGIPVYIMRWRAADHLAAVIGGIAHNDDFH